MAVKYPTTAPGFSTNPAPQAGAGAFGGVPGIIGLPPNLYEQVNKNIPGIAPAGGKSASVINSELAGQVSPDVQNLLQEKSAAMGVTAGVPGSDFQKNNLVQSLGLNADQMQHQGVADYLGFLTGTGSTMTDPKLAVDVATQNALDAAAPNPAAANAENMSVFDKYINALKGGGAGHFTPAGLGAADSQSGIWDYLQYS